MPREGSTGFFSVIPLACKPHVAEGLWQRKRESIKSVLFRKGKGQPLKLQKWRPTKGDGISYRMLDKKSRSYLQDRLSTLNPGASLYDFKALTQLQRVGRGAFQGLVFSIKGLKIRAEPLLDFL
jgi:hypothetical protein